MAERTIVVNAAVERVWDFVTALRYLSLWWDGAQNVQNISTAHVQSGTRFDVVRRGQHGPPETWIVADWEPARHLRYTEFRRNLQFELFLTAAGPNTEIRAVYSAPGPGAVLARLLADRHGAALARSLARLHELYRFNRDIKLLRGMGDE